MNYYRILFLLLITTFIYATPISIDNTQKTIEILSKSEVYIDDTRKLTIADITSGTIKFKKNDKELLGYGYSPDFDVWVRLTLKNTTDKKIEKILEYDNSMTTEILLYENKDLIKVEGLLNISNNRKTLTPSFKIKLDEYETKTFYIKASSYITTLIIKLNLCDIDHFYQREIKYQVLLSLFFGAMVILALYNLFIYFFTRDISYLFYVLYISGIIFHHLMYVGMANIYLLNKEMILFIVDNALLLVTFPIVSLALFTKYFLKIKQYPKINILLNIFLVLIFVNIVFFMSTELLNKYRNFLPVVLFCYLLIITVYSSLKKNKQAYFLLLGWCAIVLASVFMYLSSTGLFDIYKYYPYVIETSFIFEAVIFSIALADRIKQLEIEKNEMNNKLIIQEREEARRLKIQVAEKTKDLKEALDEKGLLLKELSHRVKNNMQMIISLLRLQADEVADKKVEDMFLTVQNRLNAMSHLHELLYQQDSGVTHINAYEYFDMLVDDLKQSYETERIVINLDININLEIEQSIYCGLILNELITNAIKYAFEDKNGKIDVFLKKENNKYRFNIKDNGVGFKDISETNSLGLLLVETLVKKQLRGDININTTNGVEVDIKWSAR